MEVEGRLNGRFSSEFWAVWRFFFLFSKVILNLLINVGLPRPPPPHKYHNIQDLDFAGLGTIIRYG